MKRKRNNNSINSFVEQKKLFPVIGNSRKNYHSAPILGNYPELYLFKNEIDLEKNGQKKNPYQKAKSRIVLYRTIFFCLGVIYFFLAFILYSKSLTWACTVIFGNCFLLKSFLITLSIGCSFFCIGFGFFINTEKEAAKKIFFQAKSRLKRAYENKSSKSGINIFFEHKEEFEQASELKDLYFDTLEKLQDDKEHTLHLLERIANKKSLDLEEKEKLFNQALLESKDRLDLLIRQFKQAA